MFINGIDETEPCQDDDLDYDYYDLDKELDTMVNDHCNIDSEFVDYDY